MFLYLLIAIGMAEDITEIKKGTPAQYDGVLISNNDFIKMVQKIEFNQEMCVLETEKQLELQKIQFDYQTAVDNSELFKCQTVLEHTENVFENYRANQKDMYITSEKSRMYNIIIGMAIGMGFMSLSAWTYSQINVNQG